MSHPFDLPPSPRLVEPDVYIPTFSETTPIDLTNFNEGLDESVFSGTLFYDLCALDAPRHPSNPPETLRPPPVLPPQDLSLQSVESIFAELYEACATPPSDDPLAPSAGKPYVPWDSSDIADTPPPSPSPLVPPRTKKRQKRDASADLSSACVTPTTVSDTPSSSPSPLVSRTKKRQKRDASADLPSACVTPTTVSDTPSSSPSPLVSRTKKRQKRDASADLSSACVTPTTVSDAPSSSPSPLVSRTKKRQKTAHLSSAAAAAGVTPPAVSSVEQENVHAHSERDCDTNAASDTIRRPTSEVSPRTVRPLATRMPQPQSTTATASLEGTTAEALSPTPRTQSGSGARAVTKAPLEIDELDYIQFNHWLNSTAQSDSFKQAQLELSELSDIELSHLLNTIWTETTSNTKT
ncbi:hypothetical protein GGX14DRAFT_558123 [Mycena pura]|uniref:Uncharacterized protein n=1 Tax=Mycena pura TaxID=153505 RepID=A0AAD6YMD7_9AGAR|nr:hypothetical protein GGX14DRAFT_558123 [Mycena pura]